MCSVNDLELFSKVTEAYLVIFKTGYQRQLSFVAHGPLVFVLGTVEIWNKASSFSSALSFSSVELLSGVRPFVR